MAVSGEVVPGAALSACPPRAKDGAEAAGLANGVAASAVTGKVARVVVATAVRSLPATDAAHSIERLAGELPTNRFS